MHSYFSAVNLSKTFEAVPVNVIFIFTQKDIITIIVGFGIFLRSKDIAMSNYGFHL